MKHKVIYGVILTILTGIMAFAGWKIWEELSEYETGEEAYDEIEQHVIIPTPLAPQENATTEEIYPPKSDDDGTVWPEVDFTALQEINPDILAWIYIDGTEINYPVVQGEDNSYYLKHLFTGEWNSSGCIFLDSRNNGDFSDRHNVIYGHHMKNGSMFSGLDSYKKQDFYKLHPVVLILTPDQYYKMEIFSAYVANVEENAWEMGFTAAEYEAWLKEIAEKTCITTNIVPAVTDSILTLSTCSYEFNDARFVVHGILR